MTMMTSPLSFMAWVTVALVLLMSFSCVVAQPIIQANGLFVVGKEKTIACYVNSAETPTGFPVTWSRDGVGLTASREQVVAVTSDVNSYNSYYKFNVTASDNLSVFRCTATFPSGATSATWNVYVYKGPDTPIITGPSSMVSGVSSTWQCLVDGASSSAPSVDWQFGNNSKLDSDTFTSSTQVYTDRDQLEIHRETSVLTLTVTAGAPSFTLTCQASHFDSGTTKSADFPVTVQYPPQISGGSINYTATEGSTATIYCEITAYPLLTSVTWYKDGVPVDMRSGRLSGGTVLSPSLVFNNVARADVGFYLCSASNSQGTANGTANYLTVRYVPIITYSQNPVSGVSGSDLTLSCNINSVPAYTTVFWHRIDSLTGAKTPISSISSPSKYAGGTAGTTPALTILTLDNSDVGLYRCVVDNNVGRGEGGNLQVQVNYAPVMTLEATSYIRDVTQSLTIECSYDANPSPLSVSWYKDGQLVDVSGSGGRVQGSSLAFPSLTIVQLTSADAGAYVCSAVNSVGRGFSDAVNVVMNYPAEFVTTVTQFTQQEGTSVTLPCSYSAYPPAVSLLWPKDGVQLSATGRYIGGTLATPPLTVSPVTSSDAGVYVCLVTNAMVSVGADPISLTVQYRVQRFPPGSKRADLADCSFSANPLATQVLWTKNGVRVLVTFAPCSGGTVENPDLTIVKVVAADAGSYECTVVNSQGNASTGNISVLLKYPPKISTGNANQFTKNDGQSVTIPCAFEAEPAATSLEWLLNNHVINTSNSSKYSGGTLRLPALTVTSLSRSDVGAYQCRVANDVGVSDSGNVSVYVSFKPQISGGQSTVSATEPQSVTLACQAQALPAVQTLTWYKNGLRLETSGSSQYSGGTPASPSLTFARVGAGDEGQYYCVAVNAIGSTTGPTTQLNVNYFPTFTIPDTAITASSGTAATLTVSVAANPALTYVEWRKRDTASSSSYSVINVSTTTSAGAKYSGGTLGSPSLQIRSVVSADAGYYTLVARNPLGTRQSSEFVLTVSSIPPTPTVSSLAQSYLEGDSISLTCSTTATTPTPSFRWYRGSSLLSSGPVLSIASATADTNGQYRCEAYNSLGSSDVTVTVNVFYKPRASSALSDVSAAIGQTVTLQCATEANPLPSSYTWTHNGQVVSSAASTRLLTVTVNSLLDLGTYSCRATNDVGTSDLIAIDVTEDSGEDGNVGASTEDSGLSTATLVLIIIVILIILVVVVLVIVCFCSTRKCFRKGNDVGPSQAPPPPPPPAVIPYPSKPSEPRLSGYYSREANGHISMEDDKAAILAPMTPGLTISVPDGHTPRPHHLPPLGQEGAPQVKESARGYDMPTEKKKKRRRRRHHPEDSSPQRYDPDHINV